MIITYKHNYVEADTVKSHWYVFLTSNRRYTRGLQDRIRKTIAERVDPKFAAVPHEQIRGWFTSMWNTMDTGHGVVRLESDSATVTINEEDTTLIEV